MNKINKLAEFYEEKANEDIYGDVSLIAEAEKLSNIAGKLLYKSNKIDNKNSEKLRHVSKVLLLASDVLKKL